MSDIRLSVPAGDVVPGLTSARRQYHHAQEEAEDALTDALVATWESITGHKVNDALRERLWQVARGEC